MAKKIGVDLGGTNMRVGIVENDKVIKYLSKETPKTKDELLEGLTNIISESLSEEISGIGIACPGPLKDGAIKNTPNLPLKNFNLKKFLEKKFGKKIAIENDAKCVALSEIKFGVKKKNFLVLTFGTGVGGGIIIDSKLYTGNGNAGEMGHIILSEGKDFEKHWQESKEKIKAITGGSPMIKDLMKSKEKEAEKILEGIYQYCGQAIGSLINIFNPEAIVLMGGAREAGKDFIRGIQKEAKKYVIVPDMPDILWSKIEHPGILGASLLVE